MAMLAVSFFLSPLDNRRLANLCGAMDGNLSHIERALTVNIQRRGEQFRVRGNSAKTAADILKTLYKQAENDIPLQSVQLTIAHHVGRAADGNGAETAVPHFRGDTLQKPFPNNLRDDQWTPRNDNQRIYREKINQHSVTICTGPAGVGKTHVALTAALSLLQNHRVRRIILTRPTVEAGGEKIGFLPGDMEQKINPYLRPLHDILYALLGRNDAERRIANGEVEVIPLAFMRGLTLDEAMVILDEAQNTGVIQMKMLLTRLGVRSKMVINGDATQSDLPPTVVSGLDDILNRFARLDDICYHAFGDADIVRHPLVRDILKRYETKQAK